MNRNNCMHNDSLVDGERHRHGAPRSAQQPDTPGDWHISQREERGLRRLLLPSGLLMRFWAVAPMYAKHLETRN